MDASVSRLERAQEPSFFQKPAVKKCITCALSAIAFAAAATAVYYGFTRHYAKAAASAAVSLVALLLSRFFAPKSDRPLDAVLEQLIKNLKNEPDQIVDEVSFPSKKAEDYEEPPHFANLIGYPYCPDDAPLPGNTPKIEPLKGPIEALLKALADTQETIQIDGKEHLKDSTWESMKIFATEKFTSYFTEKFKNLKNAIQSMEMIPEKGVFKDGSRVSATYYFEIMFSEDIDKQYHVSSQIMECTIAYNTLDENPATMSITSLNFNAPELLPDVETCLPPLPTTEAEAITFLTTFELTNCLVEDDFLTYFGKHWGPQCQTFGWTIEQHSEDGDDFSRTPSIVFRAKNGETIHTIASKFVFDDDVLQYSFYPKNS